MTNGSGYCLFCMSALPPQPGPCPHCGRGAGDVHHQPHQLPAGFVLAGRYLLGRTLGQGGFGITYIGRDLSLGRTVAVKEFYPAGCVDRDTRNGTTVLPHSGEQGTYFQSMRTRFSREAGLLANFSGESAVVNVLEFLEANGTAYIVMDYVEGTTLQRMAAVRGGRLPAQETLLLLRPVMRALARVHQAGLLHRDISPDNIIIRPSGEAVLIDFGAAREMSPGGEHSNTVNVKHGYAPEEQYRTRGQQGPWTDVYALCATIYRLTTGVTPPQALDRIMGNDPLIPPNRLGAGLTEEQEGAVLKGLAVEAVNRPYDMAVLESMLWPAPSIRRKPEGKTGKLLWLWAALGIGAACVIAIVLLRQPETEAKPAAAAAVAPSPVDGRTAYETGRAQAEKGNWEEAFAAYRDAAEAGYAPGQNALGECYRNGTGTETDAGMAFRWFTRAAEQGDPEGERNLGCCYYDGIGEKQEFTQAFRWFSKAAEQGDAPGQCWLGLCYENGTGTEKNGEKAAYWYRRSAEQGNATGQRNYGFCCQNGIGRTQDYEEAVSWYRLSAQQGNASAMNQLGYCYEHGLGVTADGPTAFQWYLRSAEAGSAWGEYGVGHCYYDGIGVPQDLNAARDWFERSAAQGNAYAAEKLKSYQS